GGHHFNQPLMKRLGGFSAGRGGFFFYNTRAGGGRFIGGGKEKQKFFGQSLAQSLKILIQSRERRTGSRHIPGRNGRCSGSITSVVAAVAVFSRRKRWSRFAPGITGWMSAKSWSICGAVMNRIQKSWSRRRNSPRCAPGTSRCNWLTCGRGKS